VNILLDTHIFLWFISGDQRLPDQLREEISNSSNQVFLSAVSIWEATIKFQLGKLDLPAPPSTYLPLQRSRHLILALPLDEESVGHLSSLPSHHRDPFDRILICQAIQHRMVIATVDSLIEQYGVPTLGAV
jgi:PIN domain nuclease of toxin-antitoxin system